MRRTRGTVGFLAVSLMCLSPTATAAEGDGAPPQWGQGNVETEGSGGGKSQSAKAKVSQARKVVVEGGRGKSGGITPRNTNWEPPACWYEPTMSPKELKKFVGGFKPKKREKEKTGPLTPVDAGAIMTALERQGENLVKNYYQVDKYKNFNMAKQGKGMFWEGVKNPDKKDDPKADDCMTQAIWVDKGKTPDVPNPVSPKVLAEYAYGEMPIPDTDISLSPKGKQTVNLKTWAWLDKARFKPVKVRAELPGTGLWAETTAEPYSLSLEPGTDDAETYPGGGTCVIENGRIGAPYAKGKKNATPPCGLKYLRATPDGQTYALKATLTWKISWKGADGAGGALPEGSYGDTQNLKVGEVQSVVRD